MLLDAEGRVHEGERLGDLRGLVAEPLEGFPDLPAVASTTEDGDTAGTDTGAATEAAAPAAEAADVALLYNGSVQAELHDCGCKSRPLGGLARRAALIDEVSQDREVLACCCLTASS